MADPSDGMPPITIPALTFRRPGGSIDLRSVARYAERAAGMSVRYFLISGTTGRGAQATVTERAQLLEAWRQVMGPGRLLAACWAPDDFRVVADLGIPPMLVLRHCGSISAVLDVLRAAPDGCWVYSHPGYSPVTFTPDVAAGVRESGRLPGGAKVSKVTQETVARLRAVTGSYFELWHGSSRNIAASLDHGATGVVSAPLSSLPDTLHGQLTDEVQRAVDEVQRTLDTLSDRASRIDFLLAAASRTLGIREP